MKFQTLNFGGAAVLALLLTSCIIHIPYNRDYYEIMSMGEYFGGMQKISKNMEKATAMMPGNEFERQAAGQDKNFHYNPLLLNGKPLNYANFSIDSKGILTMVEGDPESPKAVKIPFLIYLRRDSVILGRGEAGPEVYEIEIADILMFAQPGDHLIVTPAQKTNQKATRTIKVIVKVGC